MTPIVFGKILLKVYPTTPRIPKFEIHPHTREVSTGSSANGTHERMCGCEGTATVGEGDQLPVPSKFRELQEQTRSAVL